MNQPVSSNGSKSLFVALLFCLGIFFIIFIALTIRFVSILTQGNFDGHHRFTIAVLDGQEKKNMQKPTTNVAVVLSFAPDIKTISVLRLNKSNITEDDLMPLLGIPIDGFITIDSHKVKEIASYMSKDGLQHGEDVQALLQTSITNYNNISTNLTIIDLARLWFFARGESNRSFTFNNLTIGKDGMDELVIDRLSASLFGDEAVQEEKISIHIINGTGISGLGNKLARMMSNMGGNVVAVSTADAIIPTAEIHYIDDSYTVARLTKFLGYKTIKNETPGMTDIIIKLGKNIKMKGIF